MVFYFLVRSFLINFKKDFINNELNYKGYFLENIELYTIFTDFNSVELDKILNYDNNLSHYDYEYDNIFFEKLLYISRYKNFYRHPIDNFDIFYFLKNDQWLSYFNKKLNYVDDDDVFYKHDNLIENINTLESGDNAWFNKITQNIIKAVPSNMDDEFVFDEFSNELFAIFENLDFNDNYCKNIIEIDNNGIFFETECMSKTLKLNKICKDGVFMNFLYF